MSANNEQFIPLDQLEDPCWNVNLPEFVDANRIGVHLGRLGALAILAGFKEHVHVTGFDGDRTEHNPMIVGSDSQGTAFMGVGAVKSARLSENRFYETNEPHGTGHAAPFLDVNINTAEITQRVQQGKVPVRDPAAWAPHLNDAIGDGLRRAAWQHLVREPRYPEAIGAGGYVATSLLIDPEFFLQPVFLAYTVLTFNLMKGVSGTIIGKPLREICWSTTPIIHPDRALAVSALTRTRKIVKALSRESDTR